jgi:hypothetical protein
MNSLKDTVFTRLYTDTNLYWETTGDIVQLPNGYLLSGEHGDTGTTSHVLGMLLKIDTLGNMLWRRTYTKNVGEDNVVSSLSVLPDGRILVGLMSQKVVS